MKVDLTRRAIADIYWIADNFQYPAAERRTEYEIRRTLKILGEFPGTGRFRPQLNASVVIVRVRRRRYLIYYRLYEDTIVITHICDGRRAPVKPGEV